MTTISSTRVKPARSAILSLNFFMGDQSFLLENCIFISSPHSGKNAAYPTRVGVVVIYTFHIAYRY